MFSLLCCLTAWQQLLPTLPPLHYNRYPVAYCPYCHCFFAAATTVPHWVAGWCFFLCTFFSLSLQLPCCCHHCIATEMSDGCWPLASITAALVTNITATTSQLSLILQPLRGSLLSPPPFVATIITTSSDCYLFAPSYHHHCLPLPPLLPGWLLLPSFWLPLGGHWLASPPLATTISLWLIFPFSLFCTLL